jgi:protein-tyrosine kinase
VDQIRRALDKARLERSRTVGGAAERTIWRGAGPAASAPVGGVDGGGAMTTVRAPDEPVAGYEFSRPFALDAAACDRGRLVLPGAHGAAAAAFRLLRTQVLVRMREHDWRTLGVASARSGDGKTTVAANLAMAIAADPRHTALLVDLDLRRPGVAAAFGVTPAAGVDDVLAGRTPPGQAFTHPDGIERLRLLPARAPVPNSSSVVAGALCHALVQELRERYVNRIVLIDLPPVLEADDAMTLASQVDCLLLVVAEGRTAREDLARALALLRDTPVVGTVLNRSVEAVASEAYG